MSLALGYAIQPAQSQQDLQAFARLVLEYSQWLGVDLGFQAFEKELASLPGCYAAPDGCILLLQHQPDPDTAAVAIGCVAVRPLHANHSTKAASRSPTPATSTRPQDVQAQHYAQEDPISQAHAREPPQQQQPAPAQQAQQPKNMHNQLGPSSTGSSQQALPGAAEVVDTAGDISSMCEMKRLWVTQQHKGKGLGKALAVAAVEAAQKLGYSCMVLDTLDTLTAANRLYEGLGFQRRNAYYHNPLAGVVYWQLILN